MECENKCADKLQLVQLPCQPSSSSGAVPSIHRGGKALGVPEGWGRDTPWCLHLPVLESWDAAWSWDQSCMLCAPGLLSQLWQDLLPPASPCAAQPAGQDPLSWV